MEQDWRATAAAAAAEFMITGQVVYGDWQEQQGRSSSTQQLRSSYQQLLPVVVRVLVRVHPAGQ